MNSIFSQHFTARFVRLIIFGLSLALLAMLPRSGHSAPAAITRYVAPGGGDGNNCLTPATACEHIQAAIDKSGSGDTISIAVGTYLENLEITDKSLTLQGQGSATTIVNGNSQERVLFLSDDVAATPMSVVVSGLRLQNGQSDLGGAINNETATVYLTVLDSEIAGNAATTAGGGGIFNQGILKLVNVIIRDNTANNGYGGGIYNLGEADLNNTTVTNNIAGSGGGGIRNTNLMTITNSLIGLNNRSNADNGGGITNLGTSSKVILVNSTVSGNRATVARGGGVYNDGIVISSGTLISGNLSIEEGGGIYNEASGQVIFTGGGLRANQSNANAGGAFFNAGTVDLTGALVTNNQASTSGGGIHNAGGGRLSIEANTIISNTATGQPGGGINNQGTLTLTKSALVYNAAAVSQGGGLHNAGTAQLTNVTVSDNTATSGGGIHNISGTLAIQFSTISYNSSPALNRASGSVTVGNSILAQTTGNACAGTINSVDYNLDRGNSCGFTQAHDLINTDPQLGTLRDNGGGSLTRAIAFGSAAQDTAITPCPPPTDQRDIIRPQFDTCDRGAYEVAGYTNPNPLDIPANQCVTSTLPINDQYAIGRLLAGVNLTYTSRAELTIRLLSPGPNRARLLGPAANSGQNLDALFDDSAAQGVPTGDQDPTSPFFSPAYQSATPLQQFVGVGVKGNWRLEICNSGSSTGTLNRWIIVVPEITNFKVYMPLIRRN